MGDQVGEDKACRKENWKETAADEYLNDADTGMGLGEASGAWCMVCICITKMEWACTSWARVLISKVLFKCDDLLFVCVCVLLLYMQILPILQISMRRQIIS